jgi:glycosyltransferase involved in cell wall biosynthesis
MNIGFDAKRLFNNFTGLGNYSRTLVNNLAKYYPENQYVLYTPSYKDATETQVFLKSETIKTIVPKTFSAAYWRSLGILKQLKIDKIELYHGLSHEIPLKIHKTGIKSIVTIHDLIFKVYPNTYSSIDRMIYDTKFRYSCQHADCIVAVSESTKWDIVNYFNIEPIKIEVIYQACNALFGQTKPIEKVKEITSELGLPDEYLLYVGSVVERKNLVTLINAYAYLPETYKIPLVIVGRGNNYKKRVLESIMKLKLEKKVYWIENLDSNDYLQAIYQQAKIFIYPSLYEGFGIPIVEALLNKTPVITSNTSSLPEAGGPSSWYIDPLNAEQLAYAIEKILTDEKQKEKMAEEGYQYVCKTFDEKAITSKLTGLYERTLNH